MIKRKIDRYLADFFDTHKKALMLTGARQIGKTYSIKILENGSEEATYILKIDSIDGYLIKSGTFIINTNSSVFISARLQG